MKLIYSWISKKNSWNVCIRFFSIRLLLLSDDHPRLLLPIQAKVIKAIRLLITKSVCLETRNLPAQLRAVMKEWWPPDFRKCYVDLAWIPQDHIIKLTNPIRIWTESCERYIICSAAIPRIVRIIVPIKTRTMRVVTLSIKAADTKPKQICEVSCQVFQNRTVRERIVRGLAVSCFDTIWGKTKCFNTYYNYVLVTTHTASEIVKKLK